MRHCVTLIETGVQLLAILDVGIINHFTLHNACFRSPRIKYIFATTVRENLITNLLFFLTSGATIRLADGPNPNEGRVEIFRGISEAGEVYGTWGTICDDQWDLKDAAVICRMLNYSGVLAAPMYAAYGGGSGKILFDNLDCFGNESDIEDCPHNGLGVHNCIHDEDAGVICQSNNTALPSYGMN